MQSANRVAVFFQSSNVQLYLQILDKEWKSTQSSAAIEDHPPQGCFPAHHVKKTSKKEYLSHRSLAASLNRSGRSLVSKTFGH